jgi:hypothetical protein
MSLTFTKNGANQIDFKGEGDKKNLLNPDFQIPALTIENGVLKLNGNTFSGIGVNHHRLVQERVLADPQNFSYLNGITQLALFKIPFARVGLNFYPIDANIFFNDRNKYYERIDGLIDLFSKCNIGLILVFSWRHYTFCDIAGENVDQLGNPNSLTRALLREFVSEVVNRYKTSRIVWAWEMGNEWNLSADLPNATNHLPPTNTSQGNPSTRDPVRDILVTDDMLSTMIDIGTLVKSLDPKRPLSTGHSLSRDSQWHQDQWQRGFIPIQNAWDDDSPEEAEIMAIRHCPDPYDLFSAHVYPYNYPKLEEFAGYATNMEKPLFVGEFGTSVAEEADFGAVLSTVKTYAPISALWTYDRPSDTFNVSTTNSRKWMFQAIL